MIGKVLVVVVQLSSHVQLFVTLWLQCVRLPCPSPSPGIFSNSVSIKSVMPSNHLIFCCPLLLLPSIFPNIRVFSSESALRIRWPKYWNFNFSVSPSNEYSGLVYLSRFQKASWRRWHPVNTLRENMSSPVKQMWSIPGGRNSMCKSLEQRNSSLLCVV